MSLISEHIIPGKARVFVTDAEKVKDLEKIKEAVSKLPGIKDVTLNLEVFPKQIIVNSTCLVNIETVANEVQRLGFHAITRGII